MLWYVVFETLVGPLLFESLYSVCSLAGLCENVGILATILIRVVRLVGAFDRSKALSLDVIRMSLLNNVNAVSVACMPGDEICSPQITGQPYSYCY